jgi:hypothetical protein
MRRYQWFVFVLSFLLSFLPHEALSGELTLVMNVQVEGGESLAAAEQWKLGCLIGPDTPPICSLSTVELQTRDDATVLIPRIWKMRRGQTGPGQNRHRIVFTGGDPSNEMTMDITSETVSPTRRDITSLRAALVSPEGSVIRSYTVETGASGRSLPPLFNDGAGLKEFREPTPPNNALQPTVARRVQHRQCGTIRRAGNGG